MKLLKRVNSRIVLLVGLAATQAVLVYDCWVHRNLEGFIVASLLLIPLAAAVYWIGWLVRHGVTNFEVCMVIGVGALAMILWHDGNRFPSIAVACAGLLFAMILLRRLFRPIDLDQQEENLSEYRAEATRVSPVTRHASALVAYAILGGAVWVLNDFEFPRYGDFLFILVLWDASMLIYHIVKGKRKKVIGNSTIEDATDQGGRA